MFSIYTTCAYGSSTSPNPKTRFFPVTPPFLGLRIDVGATLSHCTLLLHISMVEHSKLNSLLPSIRYTLSPFQTTSFPNSNPHLVSTTSTRPRLIQPSLSPPSSALPPTSSRPLPPHCSVSKIKDTNHQPLTYHNRRRTQIRPTHTPFATITPRLPVGHEGTRRIIRKLPPSLHAATHNPRDRNRDFATKPTLQLHPPTPHRVAETKSIVAP